MKFLARLAPYFLSALRMAAAITFIEHGTQKLFGVPMGPRVALGSLIGVAGLVETFGGALMLLGALTRPVAFVLAGEMAYAYFTVHAPQGRWPIQNQGELAVLYCFLWLYFSAAGAGPISLDRAMRRA